MAMYDAANVGTSPVQPEMKPNRRARVVVAADDLEIVVEDAQVGIFDLAVGPTHRESQKVIRVLSRSSRYLTSQVIGMAFATQDPTGQAQRFSLRSRRSWRAGKFIVVIAVDVRFLLQAFGGFRHVDAYVGGSAPTRPLLAENKRTGAYFVLYERAM